MNQTEKPATVINPEITKTHEREYNKGKTLDADTVIRDLVAFMDETGIEHVSVRNAKKYLSIK